MSSTASSIDPIKAAHSLELTLDSKSQDIGYVFIEGKRYKVTIEGQAAIRDHASLESTLIKVHMIGMTILQGKNQAKVVDITENRAAITYHNHSSEQIAMDTKVLPKTQLTKDAAIEIAGKNKPITEETIETIKSTLSNPSPTCKEVFQSIFPNETAPSKKKETKPVSSEPINPELLLALDRFEEALKNGNPSAMEEVTRLFETAKVNDELVNFKNGYRRCSTVVLKALKLIYEAKDLQSSGKPINRRLDLAAKALNLGIRQLELINVKNRFLDEKRKKHIVLLREFIEKIREVNQTLLIEKDDEIRPATGLGFTAKIKK